MQDPNTSTALSGANNANEQVRSGSSLQEAATPITGMGDHTRAPNVLPAPPATAGSTMGSKPGAKDPASPGTRQTGVTGR